MPGAQLALAFGEEGIKLIRVIAKVLLQLAGDLCPCCDGDTECWAAVPARGCGDYSAAPARGWGSLGL